MAAWAHAALPEGLEREFWGGIEYVSRFFMGEANVHRALRELVRTLESLGIPYAVVGPWPWVSSGIDGRLSMSTSYSRWRGSMP